MPHAAPADVRHIDDDELARLVDARVREARQQGRDHVRQPGIFAPHLRQVARRAEAVALRLRGTLPANEAADPVVAFIAGAWHDAGKIMWGDDYHEMAGALELVEHGAHWGLARGPDALVAEVLRRAARAILPGFALYEQWTPVYNPTTTPRATFQPMYDRLREILGAAPADSAGPHPFLPHDAEALIVMYADMGILPGAADTPGGFADAFDARWIEMEERTRVDDPALHALLPGVRPRVRDGCALVDGWLTTGFDPAALTRFRARHAFGV
jgi:hypothetical protein